MEHVYSDADYLAVYKQKQKLFAIFMGITTIYLAFCIGWLIYFISLPYADPLLIMPKIFVFVATAIYTAFAFVYLGIKYSRVRRYFNMLTNFSLSLKKEEVNYFYAFEEKTLQQDNLDVISCLFETWNKKHQEWQEREAYFDVEHSMPPLESGDYVRYVVQSNFIIEYEIIQKKVLEFEEVDEDEAVEEEISEEEENIEGEGLV